MRARTNAELATERWLAWGLGFQDEERRIRTELDARHANAFSRAIDAMIGLPVLVLIRNTVSAFKDEYEPLEYESFIIRRTFLLVMLGTATLGAVVTTAALLL